MVLADLGRKLNNALSQFSRTSVIDLEAFETLLKEVTGALNEADVNTKLVTSLKNKVRAKVKPILEGGSDKGKEANRRQLIQKVFHSRWCSFLRAIVTLGYFR